MRAKVKYHKGRGDLPSGVDLATIVGEKIFLIQKNEST
jgi:hypothetical protein